MALILLVCIAMRHRLCCGRLSVLTTMCTEQAQARTRTRRQACFVRRFVQQLRHRAAAHPSVCMRQGVATRLITAAGADYDETKDEPVAGCSYKTPDGAVHQAHAHLTVACDGMYSMLRKRLHERADSVKCAPARRRHQGPMHVFMRCSNRHQPVALPCIGRQARLATTC